MQTVVSACERGTEKKIDPVPVIREFSNSLSCPRQMWLALTDASVDSSCLHYIPCGVDPGLFDCVRAQARSHVIARTCVCVAVTRLPAWRYRGGVLHSSQCVALEAPAGCSLCYGGAGRSSRPRAARVEAAWRCAFHIARTSTHCSVANQPF